jgi:hypothetical protein
METSNAKSFRIKSSCPFLALLLIYSLMDLTQIQAAPEKEQPINLAFVLLHKPRLPKAEEIARAFDHFDDLRRGTADASQQLAKPKNNT